MNEEANDNGLQEIISHALRQLKDAKGAAFDIGKVNLSELSRMTGISRGKLRRLKKNGFIVEPHGRVGLKSSQTVLTGFTGVIDEYLGKGIKNSSVIYEKLLDLGYKGGLTTIKVYIRDHKYLLPAKRQLVAPQGNRGRRYATSPGEAYQMDWGFVDVETTDGASFRLACFAMICHHCGKRYVEFFPNAKQENLFIGMIHTFTYMGIPEYVLTDNMKSVIIRRDTEGHPVWHPDYEAFMKLVGFQTRLCKPRHPFTKGKVERLIRFVKTNFLAGRVCTNITSLNYEALRWCQDQDYKYHQAVDCVPNEKHALFCMNHAGVLYKCPELMFYLCPERRISFDGFVHYEGRRFGVPFWYTKPVCRVGRNAYTLYIYDDDLSRILTTHDVTWSRHDSFCPDQYVTEQPEEFPTMPVSAKIYQIEPPKSDIGFEKFNFTEGLWDE